MLCSYSIKLKLHFLFFIPVWTWLWVIWAFVVLVHYNNSINNNNNNVFFSLPFFLRSTRPITWNKISIQKTKQNKKEKRGFAWVTPSTSSCAAQGRSVWGSALEVTGACASCLPQISVFVSLVLTSESYQYLVPSSGELPVLKFKVPSAENMESKGSPFEAWSRPVCSHTCYAYCQEFLPRWFLPFRSIHLHFVPKPVQSFSCVSMANTGSYVGLRNKIGHPAHRYNWCRFPVLSACGMQIIGPKTHVIVFLSLCSEIMAVVVWEQENCGIISFGFDN